MYNISLCCLWSRYCSYGAFQVDGVLTCGASHQRVVIRRVLVSFLLVFLGLEWPLELVVVACVLEFGGPQRFVPLAVSAEMVKVGHDAEAENHYGAKGKCGYISSIDAVLPFFCCCEWLRHGHTESAVVLDQAVALVKIEDMEPLLCRYHQIVDLGGGSIAEISQLLLRACCRQA